MKIKSLCFRINDEGVCIWAHYLFQLKKFSFLQIEFVSKFRCEGGFRKRFLNPPEKFTLKLQPFKT